MDVTPTFQEVRPEAPSSGQPSLADLGWCRTPGGPADPGRPGRQVLEAELQLWVPGCRNPGLLPTRALLVANV